MKKCIVDLLIPVVVLYKKVVEGELWILFQVPYMSCKWI